MYEVRFMLRSKRSSLLFSSLLLAFTAAAGASAQKARLITRAVDESHVVTMSGNTRPEATAENDLGLVPDSTPALNLQMVLKRSPASQAAFEQYISDQQNPSSPLFHKWLSADQVGTMFGPAPEDVATVTAWLADKGFTVRGVTPAGTTLVFDGTAGLVRKAFHAPIHNLTVNGVAHTANMRDPEIPEALEPVVAGIVTLHNFMPRPMNKPRANKVTQVHSNISGGNGFNLVGAADLAVIYNFNPMFKAGITGKGQKIVVVEDTDQWSLGDFSAFRKAFGLSRSYPFGTITEVHPTGTNTCSDPGVNGDDGEGAIDMEWASAAAPNASIISASCGNTGGAASGFGGYIALENMLNGPASGVPNVVSVSYGESEASNGAASNLFIYNLYSLAVSEGVSVFVSSGDEGAASSDANRTAATHGIAVSGWTSTPFNVSVGGTDFGAQFLGETATYFTSTNQANYQTARSYIPEIPWNDSCASQLLYLSAGFSSAVGPNGYCNSAAASTNQEITTASGSGGPSGCATGVATTRGVVSGTCAGYPKPTWQAGLFGNPSDGVRDIPDVSLMAANGVWGSYYAVCFSDTNTSRTQGDAGSCLGDPSTWAGFGGTSISSPIWAGIQALVNQNTGQNWGNPNPMIYALAKTEYGNTGNAACNSTLGNGVAASCVFYDVTLGDMDVNCTMNTTTHTFIDCFNAGGTEGALSVSNTFLAPAYPTTVGWDYATGIGTANVTNFVNAFTTLAHQPPQ
jgi:subtilase family serine protease